jgi:cellulase/cellobiase CelA1
MRAYAHKVDTTHSAIVQAFRQAGWSVLDTSAVGSGAPDMFVAKRGVTIAVEAKTGKKQRRDNQIVWANEWNGLYLWGSDPLELLEQAEAMLWGRDDD